MSWSLKLYAEMRRELGLKNPDSIYVDPVEGLPEPGSSIGLLPGAADLGDTGTEN
jgi:hypothetical protein